MPQDDLAVRLAEVEARSKSNSHRIDELSTKQNGLFELTASVKVLATRQEAVETDVKEIKGDVKSLAMKPARRWEGLMDKSIWLIAGGLLSLALSQVL